MTFHIDAIKIQLLGEYDEYKLAGLSKVTVFITCYMIYQNMVKTDGKWIILFKKRIILFNARRKLYSVFRFKCEQFYYKYVFILNIVKQSRTFC